VTDGAAAVDIVGTPGAGAGGAVPVTLRIHGRRSAAPWSHPDRRHRSRCRRSDRAGGWAKRCSTPTSCGPTIDDSWCGGSPRRPESRRSRARGRSVRGRSAGRAGGGAARGARNRGRDRRSTGSGNAGECRGPPAEPALIGQANRALAARGGRWRFGSAGTPGPIARAAVPAIAGLQVTRRYRIEVVTGTLDGERVTTPPCSRQ